jgi:hypothetical protein
MPAERAAAESGALPDPSKNSAAADFSAALSDAQADCFLRFCREARSAASPETLIGGFYGYWWSQTDFPNPTRSGHLALQRVLDSPDVDFLASPLDYSNRGVGGVTSSQAVTSSVTHHGKHFINSADVKLSMDKHGWWQSFIKVPQNDAEGIELLKRDFGFSMAEGLWHSWVDLFGGAFSCPAIKSALQRLQRIAVENPDLRRPPKAEALLVIDELSLRLVTPNSGLWTVLFPVQKQWNLHRSGFPWTFITLEDFLGRDWPDARLVNFANIFQADDQRRDAIHSKVRASGATAIWNLYPGFLGEKKWEISRAEALTGFCLTRLSDSAGDWNFSPAGGGLAAGLIEEYGTAHLRERCSSRMRHYPSPEQLAGSPRLGIRLGEGEEVMACWSGEPSVALARTLHPGFPSIFNAGPLLPDTLLHAIAKRAGVHCYAPAGDVVYANERFLCLQTGQAQTRTVQVPENAIARNLWDAATAPERSPFELKAAPDTVHYWRLDN